MIRRGFTLIEMLVTVSVFGLAFATLLAGLHIGADSLDRVERGIEQSDESGRAAAQIRCDLASVYLEQGNAKIQFSPAPKDKEVLAFFRLGPGPLMLEDRTAALQYVQYVLEEDEQTGRARLTRREYPVVLDARLGSYSELALLTDVTKLSVHYLSGSSWVETWLDGTKLPRAVRIEAVRYADGANTAFRITAVLRGSLFFNEHGQ